MARVKGGILHHKRRKHVLEYTKGYRWGRKSKLRQAREAFLHAGRYAFRDRRTKKREFRGLWQIQINAAARNFGLSYSQFINLLKQKGVGLDRKILATLAKDYPEIFQAIFRAASN